MGTRAHIGIMNKDRSVEYIYTHWDGYPSHHAPILLENYKDEKTIRKLMKLGDLSVLAEEIGKKHPFDYSDEKSSWRETVKVTKKEKEKYDGWCRAYGRDRGEPEDEVKSKTFANEEEFWKNIQAFAYLFKDGEWFYTGYSTDEKVLPLVDWEKYEKTK